MIITYHNKKMPEPVTITAAVVSIVSSVASSLNSIVNFSRFAYELKSTPTDVKTALDLVTRVNDDIQYAITLRAKYFKQLSTIPENLKRLDKVIAQASQSIMDIGRLLEGTRREAHGGKVPIGGRVKWILGHSTVSICEYPTES